MGRVVTVETPPIEVRTRLYGWAPGDSEVELAIPEESDLAHLLADASPVQQGFLFARLRRHLLAELTDAFRALETGEPAASASRAAGGGQTL
jgi:hypothetical protein